VTVAARPEETAVLASLYILATPADDVDLDPTGAGAPGGEAMTKMLNWLAQYSLWMAVAAVALGGGLFAWARLGAGGRTAAISGTALVGGGVVGALFVGLGADLVNTFHDLGVGG
jgi:hypothetical protein